MIEIKIPKNITPKKVNELYNRYISKNTPILKKCTLVIPKSIGTYRFGLLADLLRFIITLNQVTTIKKLKIDVFQKEVDTLYNEEYTYPIISLLWNKAIFLDKEENEIKTILRDKQNEFFKNMNSLNRMKGNKYLLSITDHLSKNNGQIKFIETSRGFNENEKQFKTNIGRVLNEQVLTFSKNTRIEISNLVNSIGAVTYELSKNTYEWGRKDINGIELPSSIRGLYFRFHINKIDKVIKEYKGTALEVFFKHKYIKNYCINEQEKIYYLEILVYDSGIGLIEQFTKRKADRNNFLSKKEKIEIIKKCLIKHQTSSKSDLKSKKGIGLDRILQLMNQKGFVRISTDDLIVYRDLIKDEYQKTNTEDLEKFALSNWHNRFSKPKQAQGTYISIIYPFKNRK